MNDPPDRPATRQLGQVVRMARLLAPYRGHVVLAAAALAVAAGSVLILGQGVRVVIDGGFASRDPASLDRALVGLLAVIVSLSAAAYTRFYAVSWLGERVTADLRRDVFGRVLDLSPGFFETTRTGTVISRLTSDTALIEVVIGSSASLAVRNLLVITGSLAMLFVTSAKLTALVLVGAPLAVGPILLYGRRVRRLSRDTQDRVADVSAYADQAIHEIRTVQAYGHEPHDRVLFGERVERAFDAALARTRSRAVLVAAVILLSFGSVGVILWIGGHDVLAARMSAGELSAFVFYAVLFASGAAAISEVIGDLQRAAGATERVMALLEAEPEIRAPEEPVPLPEPPRGEVRLHSVTFRYPSRPDVPALSDFSLAVRPGDRLALVGPSGAGKSTVFQLLLRYYDPDTGAILIDGVDVRRADPRAVRSRLALVPQDPVIFAASVRDNVRYARPDASDAEVVEACASAYAMEFIERLPGRLDASLGERGVRLSAGQRQRLSIARALLANRAVLLLDEATSSLDAESEHLVQLALARLMEGRTTLIIAHRLATVQGADRILVMDHGRVVASGSHAELVRAGGLYSRLAALQLMIEPEPA